MEEAVIVVTGREPSVLVALTDELCSRGVAARLLVDREALYETVRAADARAIVSIDRLPRFVEGAASGATDAHDAPWEDIVRAARSPRRPRVILCTAKEDDSRIRELKRSGISYAIVRTGTLVSALDVGLTGAEGKTVHLARNLPVPDLGLTPLTELATALADAAQREDAAGKLITVRHTGEDAWEGLVASCGGRAKITSPTMANLASWFGRPALPWVRTVGGVS